MSDVKAQYERIVRMIPVGALQSSYNSVLQDGISSVNDAMDEVVAALSHLKEVRDAVDKLGQDKPQRNESLLKTMDNAMALRRKLELELRKMIQVVNATNGNRKRSRSGVSTCRGVSKGLSKGDSNTDSNAETEGKSIATTTRLQLSREREGNDESRKRNGEFQNESQKRIRLSSASAGTSRILNLLPPIEEEKTPLRPIEIIECTEDNVVVGGLKTSRQYLKLAKSLPSTLSREEQQHKTLLKNGKQKPIRSRLKIIPRMLLLLKDVMLTDEDGAQKAAIADSMEELLKWIVKGYKMWQDLGAYQVFAVILSSYAEQHSELQKLKKIADRFSKTIVKIRLESSGGEIVQADSRQGTDNVQPTAPMQWDLEETNGKSTNANENGGKQRESGTRSSQRMELTRGTCLEKLRMMTQMSVATRRQQLPGVLAKLADIVPVSKKQEQLSMLKYVLLWAKLSAGSGDDMTAYDRFCKAMTTFITKSPEGGRKSGFERLNNSLLAVVKEHEAKSTKTLTKKSISYDLMVFRVNAMAPGERVKHIPEAFNSLKTEMARGAGATNSHEILNALRTVKRWVEYVPEESTLRQLYGDLAEQIELYSRGVSMFYAKVSLMSEIQNFRTIAGITRSENGETTVDGVLAKVEQLSEASEEQRLLQVDECIVMLGKVLPRTGERQWPAAVGKSYELLCKYLEPCSPGFRNQRLATLNKWMHPRRRRWCKVLRTSS